MEYAFRFIISKINALPTSPENYVTSLLEGFTPSSLRIKKRPAFKAVSDTFERE